MREMIDVRVEESIQVELILHDELSLKDEYDLNQIIYDLDCRIDLLSSQADAIDYLVSVASGILCGMLDILWVGEFDLNRGRGFASKKIDNFVQRTAKLLGCKDCDFESAVKFLEKKFPIPSDGNTPEFGGGLQHHLRDFAHHPTIVGLMFSLLTQFTGKSYGTDVNGCFFVTNVPERNKLFIGKDVPSKILFGTLYWFFHLISDLAGSSGSVGKSGGTGLPGPLLGLAKELAALPFFNKMKIDGHSLSEFLSKLFNGTLLMKRDKSGAILKDTVLRFDLRGELGVGVELVRQAIPVIANECFVRSFYFIRRLAVEIRENNVKSLSDLQSLEWSKVKPMDNPTISRMLMISAGVFTTLDIGEAIVSQKYWVSVNYIGVGRLAIAIGEDVNWCLKTRNLKEIRAAYEKIKRYAYMEEDQRIYERIGNDMVMDKMGLTVEQTEILYNIEYYKTLYDIQCTNVLMVNDSIKIIKRSWLNEWKEYMTKGFSKFLQVKDAVLHWYSEEELARKIEENGPEGVWFRLILLESMLFEPYFTISFEKDDKGNDIPSREYKDIWNPITGYNRGLGDTYLDDCFAGKYYQKGYVRRLRTCYDQVLRELNEYLKTLIQSLTLAGVIALVTVISAGAFAPSIAVALVGSNFAGLSGAALTGACLAYLGGGAIAAGGLGVAGGTMAIVGGGAILGLGIGAGIGGAAGTASLTGKRNTILQSAKLLVSIREIFLNDEHDLAYSNSIHEQYLQNIIIIEKGLVELRLKKDTATGEELKELNEKVKNAEETVAAMKIARKAMLRFTSSFEEGINHS